MYLIHKIRICEYTMINSREAVAHFERIESLADRLGMKADDLVEHLEDGRLKLQYGLKRHSDNPEVKETDAWWCYEEKKKNTAINVRTGDFIEWVEE